MRIYSAMSNGDVLKLRWKLIWTAAAVTAVVLFAGTLALSRYLNSDAFRRRIVDGVNATVYGSMSIEKHRLWLFSGKLSLDGVRLKTQDAAVLADIEHIDITLFWPALVWRSIHIKSFNAAAGLVAIRYDAMDRLQFLRLRKNDGADSPGDGGHSKWSLRLDALDLSIEQALFQRTAKDVVLRCGPVAVQAGADLGRMKGQGRLSTGPITLQRASGTRILNPLTAVVTYDPSAGVALTLDSGQCRLTAKGRVVFNSTAAVMDVTADLAMDLSELVPWLPAHSARGGGCQKPHAN